MTGRSDQRAPDPDDETERHLDRELGDDDREVGVVVRRELDHPDHQRDADRVVHARLAFEDRPGAAADLARAEDRERHRRVGRGDRRADEPGEDPVEPEQVVRGHGDEPGGRERPDDAERHDRRRRSGGTGAARCAARRRRG